MGLVGESGSGKSVTGFSIFGLIDPPGEVIAGEVLFKGQVPARPERRADAPVARQPHCDDLPDPLMTLNPVLRIEEQMLEAIQTHAPVPRAQALQRCVQALEMVGIPAAASRLRSYPHEFSGGMRQRVAIAIAMLNQPELIICDEPTTALDVTIQGQILYRMQEICRTHGTALVWITHDLGVIAELADQVAVMWLRARSSSQGPVGEGAGRPCPPLHARPHRLGAGAIQPGQPPAPDQRMAVAEQPPRRLRLCAPLHRPAAQCSTSEPERTTVGARTYRCFAPFVAPGDPAA